jgi:hypothetical protein
LTSHQRTEKGRSLRTGRGGAACSPWRPGSFGRYEITFTDVPLNIRVSFRINDQNACDENPPGAVTRNVLVNDVGLVFLVPIRLNLIGVRAQ